MTFLTRARESAATLGSIGVVALVVTSFSIGSAIYLDEQGTRGVQTGISERPSVDLALRASLVQSSNGEQQDDEVRAAIANTFAPTGVAVSVARSMAAHVTVHPLLDDESTEDRGGAAMSTPDFDELASFVDGAAPAGATEVAVQADAAEVLGLATGSQVLLAGERFTVSGTWRPTNAFDARWFGDDMVVSGYHDDFGPFVINENAWSRLDVDPEVSWTVVPDAAAINSHNSAAIIDGWNSIRHDWRSSVSGIQTLSSKNRLIRTLDELEARLDGLRAVQPVVFTLLAAIGLVVMSELVRLLAVSRRRESELYWSRGRSSGGIAVRSARDVAVAGGIGVFVGFGMVAAAVVVRGSSLAESVESLGGLAPPAVVLLGSIVLAAAQNRHVGAVDLRRAIRRRKRSGAAVPAVVALAVLAAAVSVWQLRLYGSPMTPTVDGTGGVDPIAVIAPAAALVAAVLLLVAWFPAIAGFIERRSARFSLVSQLSARGLVRRVAVVSAPLMVIALAVGSATTAAGFSGTWSAAFTETTALRVGSDLHASDRLGGVSAEAQDAALQLDAVVAIAPLEVQPLSVGGESGSTLGAAPDAVATIAGAVPGRFDPQSAADAIRASIPGPVISADASALSMTVKAEGFVAAPSVVLWVTGPSGFIRSMPLDTATETVDDGKQIFTYESTTWSPSAPGPWRVAAIDFHFVEKSFNGASPKLHVRELMQTVAGTRTALDLTQFWIADSPGVPGEGPTTDASSAGFFLFADVATVRLTPSLDHTLDDRPGVPIVISQQLAERFSVAVGDSLAFPLQDGIERLNCRVAAIVPAVPGAPLETAVLIDLGVIQHFQLRTRALPPAPRDLWITTTDSADAISQLGTVLPASTRIESKDDLAGREVLGSARTVFWGAVVAAMLLALIGVASSVRARLRSGRNDFGILRALGLNERDQAAIVSREFVIVSLIGVIAGLAVGALVTVLTIPYFARAAVVAPYLSIGTALHADLLALIVCGGVLAVGIVLILALLRRAVRAAARGSLPGEASE